MDISFSQPKGFSERVFLVHARFDPDTLPELVGFDVPNVPQWFFRKAGTDNFHSAPMRDSGLTYRGLIKNGYWEFIVQSNGVSVEENKTSIAELRNVLALHLRAPLQ